MIAPNPHHRPTRHRNATLAEKWNSELLDSAGGLDTPDAPADVLNPHRTGSDPKARVAALERGRFELAHRYNPELTWNDWVEIIHKLPRGRKPKVPAPVAARPEGG